MTVINISNLPLQIQQQIPPSIRLYKNEYELNELPIDVQNLIKQYLNQIADVDHVNDTTFFDVRLDVDSKGDLRHLTNVKDTVLEYLTTYFGITEGYPFDPTFCNKLKRYIHRRNISVVRNLIDEEVEKIVEVIKSDLNVAIEVQETKIDYVDDQVIIKIDLTINSQPIEYSVKF